MGQPVAMTGVRAGLDQGREDWGQHQGGWCGWVILLIAQHRKPPSPHQFFRAIGQRSGSSGAAVGQWEPAGMAVWMVMTGRGETDGWGTGGGGRTALTFFS